MFKRKRASASPDLVVGLELDPGHLAAAEVHVNGSLAVTRGAVALLRPGILRDGEVADGPALVEALRALFAEHDLPKRVRLGIANQRIVVRTLDLPPVDDPQALDAIVRSEAPDHVPMPMDEAILDYQPLGRVEVGGVARERVMIVAIRRETVERLTAAAQEAGLKLEGIDLSAFALIRALARPEADGAVLYVNPAGLVNLAVAKGASCLFTRATPGGLDALYARLAERCGLTLEHARQWSGHVGLATPLEEVEGDPALVGATREVLEEGVGELADTVRQSLNFYRTQDSAQAVESAVLVGPAVAIPGFAERLADALRLPVEAATVDTTDDAALGDASPCRLAVAAGLAVHERPAP